MAPPTEEAYAFSREITISVPNGLADALDGASFGGHPLHNARLLHEAVQSTADAIGCVLDLASYAGRNRLTDSEALQLRELAARLDRLVAIYPKLRKREQYHLELVEQGEF